MDMTRRMGAHYHNFKDQSGTEDLLKREYDQEQEVSVPLLQNTDREKLIKTFKTEKEADHVKLGVRANRSSSACSSPAKKNYFRVNAQPAGSWQPRSGNAWSQKLAKSDGMKATPPSSWAAFGGNWFEQPDWDLVLKSGATSPEAVRAVAGPSGGNGGGGGSSGDGGGLRERSSAGTGSAAPEVIEIVATAQLQRLLVSAGPSSRPSGPTLDTINPGLFGNTGAGLKRKIIQPRLRLVRKPPTPEAEKNIITEKASVPKRRQTQPDPSTPMMDNEMSPVPKTSSRMRSRSVDLTAGRTIQHVNAPV